MRLSNSRVPTSFQLQIHVSSPPFSKRNSFSFSFSFFFLFSLFKALYGKKPEVKNGR